VKVGSPSAIATEPEPASGSVRAKAARRAVGEAAQPAAPLRLGAVAMDGERR
jgi:hypothetical protein